MSVFWSSQFTVLVRGWGEWLSIKSQLLLCSSTDCRTRAVLPVLPSHLLESGIPRVGVTATRVCFLIARKKAGCLISKSLISDWVARGLSPIYTHSRVCVWVCGWVSVCAERKVHIHKRERWMSVYGSVYRKINVHTYTKGTYGN